MVLGETEITGQVKNAYQAASQARLTGRVLNRIFQTALQTAKEIRTRTNIGRGATSVGSAAVELAEKIFGSDIARQSVMIIGAGKMGEACVRHLSKKGNRTVLVSNRLLERAQLLAAELGAQAIRLDDAVAAMVNTDIVVSSTGCPEMVLHRHQVEAVMKQRGNRPLVLIDIAVPRDIDPEVQAVNNVYLYNIDDPRVARARERAAARTGTRAVPCHHRAAVRGPWLRNSPREATVPRRRTPNRNGHGLSSAGGAGRRIIDFPSMSHHTKRISADKDSVASLERAQSFAGGAGHRCRACEGNDP